MYLPPPFDRRRALLELTRRGMRLNDQRDGTIEAAVDGALRRLSKERVATTKAVLSALALALGGDDDAPASANGRPLAPPGRPAPRRRSVTRRGGPESEAALR